MKMHMEMGSSSLGQDNRIGITGYDEEEDEYSYSSDVSSVVSSDNESDDEFDHSPSDNDHVLGNMSDLLQQLPPK